MLTTFHIYQENLNNHINHLKFQEYLLSDNQSAEKDYEKIKTLPMTNEIEENKYFLSWKRSSRFVFADLFEKHEINFENSIHFGIKNSMNRNHDFLCIGDVIISDSMEIVFLGILEDTASKKYNVLYKTNFDNTEIFEMDFLKLYDDIVKVVRNQFSLSNINRAEIILNHTKNIENFIGEKKKKIHLLESIWKNKNSYNIVQFIFSGSLPFFNNLDSQINDVEKMEGNFIVTELPLNSIPDIILDQKSSVEFIILIGCSHQKCSVYIEQINLNFKNLKYLVTDLNFAILKYYGLNNLESTKAIYKTSADNYLYIYVFESSDCGSFVGIERNVCDISKETKLLECIQKVTKRPSKKVDLYTSDFNTPQSKVSDKKKKPCKKATTNTIENCNNENQRNDKFNKYLSLGGNFPVNKCETLELKINHAVENLSMLSKQSTTNTIENCNNENQRNDKFNKYLSLGGNFPVNKCETLELKINHAVKNLDTLLKQPKETQEQIFFKYVQKIILGSKIKDPNSILSLFSKKRTGDCLMLDSNQSFFPEILNSSKKLKVSNYCRSYLYKNVFVFILHCLLQG